MTELIYPPKEFIIETDDDQINQPIFPVKEHAYVSDMVYAINEAPTKSVSFYPSMTLWYVKESQIENLCGFLESNNIKVSKHG
jgi:hypothetical protein